MQNADDAGRLTALIRLLIEDVIAAQTRLRLKDDQTTRRDIVRASLAAMEGLTWLARDHVHKVLDHIDELTPIIDLALREQAYTVSDNGRVQLQQRSVPLPTALRLVASQAQHISPDLEVAFSVCGWADLQHAVSIRNRITHPRPGSDLAVSDEELDQIESGLFWLTATINYLMARTHLTFMQHVEETKALIRDLKSADPIALKRYEEALNRPYSGG